jgi:competence protein ComFC
LVRVGRLGTDKDDRQKQMTDAFRFRNTDQLADKTVILVDDVLTTGATLEAAAKVLKDQGVIKVNAAVFARA